MYKYLLILFVIAFNGCTIANASVSVDMQAIAQIESSGQANAYNRVSGAVGMYQITPICLKDYNKFHKPQRSMKEMYDRLIAHNVANWYFNHRIPSLLEAYGIKDTIENRLIAYNAGIGRLKNGKIPRESRDYVKKYKELTNG